MGTKPLSIHVEELSGRAEKIARAVLMERNEMFAKARIEMAMFPDIGVLGYRIRDLDLGEVNAAELIELSGKVVAEMGDFARAAEPVARIQEDFITMGFFPIEPILMRDLQ